MPNAFGVANQYAADLLGYSAQHELRLLVEVKAGNFWPDADLRIWTAEQWEHNFLPELTTTWFPEPRKPTMDPAVWQENYFYLLVTAQQMVLWIPGPTQRRQPSYIVESAPVLAKQLDTSRFPLHRLDEQDLKSVVYSWLMFSQFKSREEIMNDAAQVWLVESGLYEALFHGDLRQQAA